MEHSQKLIQLFKQQNPRIFAGLVVFAGCQPLFFCLNFNLNGNLKI